MNACISRWVRGALMTLAIAAAGSRASAQSPADGSGLLIGPLTVRPMITLRDAGWDSNIFNEPGSDTEDHTATLSGHADARLRVGVVQIDGIGGADYLYFERNAGERSFNRVVSTRLQPQFVRVRPFVGAGYRRTRDRANSEIDVRAPRTEREQRAGVEAQLSGRLTVEASVRRVIVRFDEGERFRDINLATRLNRHSDTAEVSFRYELSPLTTFTVASSLVRESFLASPDRDTDTLHTLAGLTFAPDAIVRGRALVGFRDLRPRGPLAIPSRGPTTGIELSYTLLDRTVLSGRLLREATVSAEEHPYYISTLGGFEISHNVTGPVDVVARGSRERLDYDAVPAFALPAHLDRIGTLGGGVAVRLGARAKVTVNYEEIRRRSDLADVRDYERRRVYTTVSYGF